MRDDYLELDRVVKDGVFVIPSTLDIDMLRLREDCKGDYSKLTDAQILSYVRKPKVLAQ